MHNAVPLVWGSLSEWYCTCVHVCIFSYTPLSFCGLGTKVDSSWLGLLHTWRGAWYVILDRPGEGLLCQFILELHLFAFLLPLTRGSHQAQLPFVLVVLFTSLTNLQAKFFCAHELIPQPARTSEGELQPHLQLQSNILRLNMHAS